MASAADNRSGAQDIPLGSSTSSNNVGATEEVGEPFTCPDAFDYGTTVWYRFSVSQAGTATIRAIDGGETAEGASGGPSFNDGFFDPVIVLYPSGSNTLITCNDDDPTGDGVSSRITTHLNPGTYFIQLGGYWGTADPFPEEGFFTLSVDYAQEVPPPPPSSINGSTSAQWKVFTRGKKRRKTKNRSLTVKGEPGSSVTAACSKCRPPNANFTIPASGVLKLVVGGILPPRTLIEVRITKPGRVGYLARYKTRARKLPTKVDCAISPTGAAAC